MPDIVVPYPGRLLKVGSPLKDAVRLMQHRLNERGCGPIGVTGRFEAPTERAVKLFQVRFTDLAGQPLAVDGKVGPLTWEALFGAPAAAPEAPAASLSVSALAIAAAEIGTMEVPPGSNRGPRIDEFVRSVGLNPTGRFPWCAAFVYWCFQEAAGHAGVRNPVIRTAGVLDHWRRAAEKGIPRVTGAAASSAPDLVRPGYIFIMDFGGGAGHTGFVEHVAGGRMSTIEGNTNEAGSREGIGVFRRVERKLASVNKGFINYSGS